MKHIEKSKLSGRNLLSVVLVSAFAVILAVSIILLKLPKDSGNSSTVTEPPEIIEGEAIQNGLALAYPYVNEKKSIKFIHIKNETGEFGFIYSDEKNEHTLYYVDSNGKQVIYYPDICSADPSFSYSSLFAIETNDGFGMYSLLDYLCLSLQSPYFGTRIPFETDGEKRALQLKNFGFGDGDGQSVYFTYTAEDGTTHNKTIKIGEKSVTDTGYYFIVYDDGVERPYIYSSLNNYYDYAVSNMTVFIKPLIVSAGLSEDKGFGPYLTSGYYQWKNSFHDGSCECDKYTCECRGKCTEGCGCTDVCRVTEVTGDSNVIALTATVYPVLSTDASSSGIASTDSELIEIDLFAFGEKLSALKADKNYKPSYESTNFERAIAALKGKSIGKYGDPIVFSFVSASKLIDFADKETVNYSYRITSVSAIVTENGEISSAGASAGDAYDLIKVAYSASVDGKAVSAHPMYAVLDLSREGLDADAISALREARIGEEIDVTLDIGYTHENAIAKKGKYVITEIIDIYDQDGKIVEKITDSSIVGYRYEVYLDGAVAGSATYWLDLSKVTSDSDVKLRKMLVGKTVGKVSLEFEEYSSYYEYFLDFKTYSISEIDSFVTRELVSAFKFQNSSKRDPYYGESIYENLMNDEHKLYGLNASICEQVVRILGGVSNDSSTATAAGLSGTRVEAIGLSPETMKKYGLYAYTVYFELPRGIKAYTASAPDGSSASQSDLDDYTYRSTLGFNLYVSEVDLATNTRYIASDLYGVVTRVAADDFAFLSYDFETFWARRNIMLVDIVNIANLGVEFSMSDLKGSYNFELTQPTNSKTESLGVHVTSSGECTPNKFTEFISNPQNADLLYLGGTSLKTLYLYESGADEKTHQSTYPNSLGASCFGDVMKMLFNTSYTGILSEEERASHPDSADRLLRLTLELNEGVANASPYTYVYEFYRIDDRRVRVCIYQESISGQIITERVSDFYLSTYAFKKIVSAFSAILNAEVIDIDFGYRDEKN